MKFKVAVIFSEILFSYFPLTKGSVVFFRKEKKNELFHFKVLKNPFSKCQFVVHYFKNQQLFIVRFNNIFHYFSEKFSFNFLEKIVSLKVLFFTLKFET